MEEDMFHAKSNRQTVDPRIDIINKTTEPLYKKALSEFGFKLPLAFMLYNQIRFYEDYGKLNIGFNVASVDTLADQFGVSPAQIRMAYNNLTNKYKLGAWVENSEPVYRNVKRVWVSNERLKNADNYYSVIAKLLPRNSKTITAEYLPSEVRPLSESKKKVSESKTLLRNGLKAEEYGITSINKMFNYWSEATGLSITARTVANRRACSNLIKKYGEAKLRRLIEGVAMAQGDQYAPRIADFTQLQSKVDELILWGKKKTNKRTGAVI